MSEKEIINKLKERIRIDRSMRLNVESDFDRFCEEECRAIEGLIDLYNKEKEKNKELEEQLRKANEYIRNEMYIDDNPTICGDEEDTITELPISLNLYNEGLRELLELLEERN